MSLTDLGGGAINNDGRYVDGSGTAAGAGRRSHDELYRQSAVHFLEHLRRRQALLPDRRAGQPARRAGVPGPRPARAVS